jgi:hypothetical protein
VSFSRPLNYTDVSLHTEELTELALDYLCHYRGSFAPLLNAQAAAVEEGDLAPGVVKMVINCLRQDAHPSASKYRADLSEIMTLPSIQREGRPARARRPRLEVVPDPPKPKPKRINLRLPLVVKVPYLRPRSRQGKLHLVEGVGMRGVHHRELVRPRAVWHHTPLDLPWDDPRIKSEIRVYSRCENYYINPELRSTMDDPEELCVKCRVIWRGEGR